jgi:hypothetical protein
MEFKYQIIFLGSVDERVEQLTKLLFAQIRDLRLMEEAYKIILENNFKEYSGNQPAYVIYFGDENGNFKNSDEIEHLKKDGVAILPIFKNSFSDEIPESLENQNGLLYSHNEHEKIVSLILESFGKLRSTRKVFVSYRRDQSSSVAIQLYEALERKNFDVFLDTHSIKQGEPFQEELWHRMADCDVVVLLNTSKFLESRWCKEEIAEASTKRIGVVQLVWPGHKPENFADISFPVQLETTDFFNWDFDNSATTRLKENVVRDLVTLVESVRARNLASRQDSIITEFLNIGNKVGRKLVLQYERVITEVLDSGITNIFVPAVGIPQSMDCEQSEKIKRELKDAEKAQVHVIYDDLRVRNKWLDHLKWLNRQLHVKTIGKKEFEKWLTEN